MRDSERVRHLLRRFGLGASEAELDYYGADGWRGAVDKLLKFEAIEDVALLQPQELAPRGVNLRIAQAHWLLRIVATRRPLQEALTLFWHDHFAISASKVAAPLVMHRSIQTLREHCLADAVTLVTAMSQDPAMLYWLDNCVNARGKPNENFARELLELFTLGIGHYTEEDVLESARALTGWTFMNGRRAVRNARPQPNARFVFRTEDHDEGEKMILGNKGRFDGADVIGLLVAHPQTARHWATKMWEWFAYAKPEDALVDRLATGFRANGLSVRWLVEAIMTSPEFYSERARNGVYKNPVQFCAATLRQLGIGTGMLAAIEAAPEDQRQRPLAPIYAMLRASKAMGMEVLMPPDVAGWDTGPAWISTATIVERIKWSQTLFGRGVPASMMAGDLLGGVSPEEAARKLVSVFDAEMPAPKVQQLERAARDAAGAASIGRQNAARVGEAVCRLLFAAPEFQLH